MRFVKDVITGKDLILARLSKSDITELKYVQIVQLLPPFNKYSQNVVMKLLVQQVQLATYSQICANDHPPSASN